MKNYAKVGNRDGRPAYRTASVFRYKKYVTVAHSKSTYKRAYQYRSEKDNKR